MNTKIDITLTPSLWRTCRALANLKRLRLFQAMIDMPPQTVSTLAMLCGLPVPVCSQYLRQLDARGLCKATRKSRWVFYHLETDPKVRHSEAIEQAIASALRGKTPQCRDNVFADLTAYTHPRRITIVHALASRKSVRFETLCSLCAISRLAMERHLEKLEHRSIVVIHDDDISLARPQSPLAKALLAVVAATSLDAL